MAAAPAVPRRWPRRLAAAAVALVGLLGVQALLALRGEHLPDDPGYSVDLVVRPAGGGGGAPIRLAVLGDSTVAGLGSPTAGESLAALVAQRVADALDRPVRVLGFGVSGARTADLVREQLPAVAGFAPDALVAVVGSNDVTHLTPPRRLRAALRELGAAVDAELGVPVILAGIPLFGGADALAEPLRTVVGAYAGVLRPAQRAGAQEAGMAFVEIARDASPRFAGVPEAMSWDGFHPAPVGYGFWADAIAPVVVEALPPAPRRDGAGSGDRDLG